MHSTQLSGSNKAPWTIYCKLPESLDLLNSNSSQPVLGSDNWFPCDGDDCWLTSLLTWMSEKGSVRKMLLELHMLVGVSDFFAASRRSGCVG
jgi:hypothetical protein